MEFTDYERAWAISTELKLGRIIVRRKQAVPHKCVLGLLSVAFAGSAVGGCATPYQPEGLGGGYSEFYRTDRQASVTFKANAHTDWDDARKMALRRSAEVALENGFDAFTVESNVDHSEQTSYGSGSGLGTVHGSTWHTSSSGTVVSKRRPQITLDIRMFKKADAPEDAIDARAFITRNFPAKK